MRFLFSSPSPFFSVFSFSMALGCQHSLASSASALSLFFRFLVVSARPPFFVIFLQFLFLFFFCRVDEKEEKEKEEEREREKQRLEPSISLPTDRFRQADSQTDHDR
jgi:hypothetical protein